MGRAPAAIENIMTNWLGMPPLATTTGGQIDNMIGWMDIFIFVLFIGWGGFFLYALIRFRRSRNPVASYTRVKSHASNYSEIAGAGVAAIFLVAFSIARWGVWGVESMFLFAFSIPLWAARVDRLPPESEALVVNVTGEQFAWNIHYPGPDGEFGLSDISLIDVQSNPLGLDRNDPAAKDDVTMLNQLFLPVNKPIIVRLPRKEVHHRFAVPSVPCV